VETDAARELAERFSEYAQTVWTTAVSDVEWDPDLDRTVHSSIQRVLEALVPDGEAGLVKSADGPLGGVLTDDALYLVGLARITADNVNHSITPVARRIPLDQPAKVIAASVEIGRKRGEVRGTVWRFEFAHETLVATAEPGPDFGFMRAIAEKLGWQGAGLVSRAAAG
jgi:hypothetical protein